MRYSTSICALLAAAFLVPAGAQEDRAKTKVLAILANRQKRAVEELNAQLARISEVATMLRQRGEASKADLLEQAVSLVTERAIGVAPSGDTHPILRDLEGAMNEMAKRLEESQDATAEVEDIGKKVVETLDQVVSVLIGQDDLKSLQEREEALREARDQVGEMADRQADLRRETTRAVPRTAAEQAAEQAGRDLRRLEQELLDLDQTARRGLKDVDAAQERAARLEDLLNRQQRLRQETAVRRGETDVLTPRIHRALAELEAVRRAAEQAAEEAAAKAETGQAARELGDLARRQEQIAKEIETREALERARDAARGETAASDLRAALEKAAQKSPDGTANDLRRAAANLGADPKAREAAAKAAEDALERMASRETLARDEGALARDVDRTAERAPASDRGRLEEAAAKAREAAGKAEAGGEAAPAARESAAALQEAADAMKKAAEAQAAEPQAAEAAEGRAEAADRAERLAEQLDAMAQDEATKKAGMADTARQAAEAARRAAGELREAAEAATRNEPGRAAEKAAAAAERTHRTSRDLEEALQMGTDLVQRQGAVAEDLKQLGAQAKGEDRAAALESAGAKAEAARESLKKGEMGKATAQQDAVLEELRKLAAEARKDVEAAAAQSESAVKRAAEDTESAAKKAEAIAGDLERGSRTASEDDARRRMEAAAKQTQEAAEALRRSLRRLGENLVKSAEQDRKEAQEKVAGAQRSLQGLREAHKQVGEAERNELQKIGEKQERLEQEVRNLEERLSRMREQAGADRLQDAQSAMRESRQRLQQGDADEAERAQERAEKSLREAERELDKEERRYRALRQYELLFKLKEELKNFRRTAQAHREWLQKIDALVRQAGRVTRLIRLNEIDKLEAQLTSLQRDVADKADAVEKEGAVVYTYILKNSADDLKEVGAQLALKEVGLVPQEILGDVVRRFDLAVRGLEKDLREQQEQQQQQQQQPQGQQPGNTKPTLVPPDAEIRMVMVLQEALNEERELFFDNRPDFGTRRPTDAERTRVERLYHRQGSLAELFDSLRSSLLRGEDPDAPDFGEEEQR